MKTKKIDQIEFPKFFVSQAFYENRDKIFLRALKTKKVDSLALGKSIKQRYIYEVELKDKNVDTKKEDFIIPEWRSAE